MITTEEWMDLLSYRQMVAAGATWAEIARLAGCDWRTARKYLSAERPKPPRYKPRPAKPKLLDPYLDLVDAELRASRAQIRATTIHERLVSGHGYPGSYQRVKEYVRTRRASGSVRERCVAFVRRFPRQSTSGLRPPPRGASGSSSSPSSVGGRLFKRGGASMSVPSTLTCSRESSLCASAWSRTAEKKPSATALVTRRSRFFVNVVAWNTGSPRGRPTNQRRGRL